MKQYYFAIREVLSDLGCTPVQGYHKYFEGRLSRQSIFNLCRQTPVMIRAKTQDIICDALGLTPSDLWREKK